MGGRWENINNSANLFPITLSPIATIKIIFSSIDNSLWCCFSLYTIINKRGGVVRWNETIAKPNQFHRVFKAFCYLFGTFTKLPFTIPFVTS